MKEEAIEFIFFKCLGVVALIAGIYLVESFTMRELPLAISIADNVKYGIYVGACGIVGMLLIGLSIYLFFKGTFDRLIERIIKRW